MYSRSNHFWITVLAAAAAWAALVGAGVVRAANSMPVADAWNITSSGKAGSSGELLFRVTGEAGSDPVEVTVYVLSGSNESGVASSIRKALSSQLDARRFNVEAGEGPNVLLSRDGANRGFSVELLNSDVDDVRITVQSATPVAPPTVPSQQMPATPPMTPRTPPASGDASSTAPSPAGSSASPASPTTPPAAEAPPADGGAGAPATAPPPPGL